MCMGKEQERSYPKNTECAGEMRIIEGVDTNIDYQYGILNHPEFLAGMWISDFLKICRGDGNGSGSCI